MVLKEVEKKDFSDEAIADDFDPDDVFDGLASSSED